MRDILQMLAYGFLIPYKHPQKERLGVEWQLLMQQIFSEYPSRPGMVLGSGETARKKTNKVTGSHRVYIQERERQ